MPTFKKDDGTVADLIEKLQNRYECYNDQIEARVSIDVLLAYCDRDDGGNSLNDALRHHGVKALGIARSIGQKDRAMGRGDAEIALDGDWWDSHNEEDQLALLDHELYHIVPKRDPKTDDFKTDDMHRPLVKMRPHDEDFGWFRVIAARHGNASIEQQQAAEMLEVAGQFYWPDIIGAGQPPLASRVDVALSAAAKRLKASVPKGGSMTISGDGFSHTIKGEDA